MDSTTRSYKDLIVWQKAIELAKLVYRLTMTFPNEEKFGLTAQLRRAAVSVPSNIAEGQARRTTGEFVQFISHAEGSIAELDTQLILSLELKFCPMKDVAPAFELLTEIRKMLNALRRTLATRGNSSLATRHSSL
ncbi:MAG: four helix bundle protein [Chthoniobacterales bacterium]